MCVVAAAVSGCSILPLHAAQLGPGGWQGQPSAGTHVPSAAATVLSSTSAEALTAEFTQGLFASSPSVVVAADTSAAVRTAQKAALADNAPLLIADGTVSGQLVTEIKSLHPRAVLAVGVAPAKLTTRLPGLSVVTSASALPAPDSPTPLRSVAVLVHSGTDALVNEAVTTTARIAGATVITMDGWDPRAYPDAIKTLATVRPAHVVAVGAKFGPTSKLAARVAVAETGTQLPGGGQVMFPGRRLVALYGCPGTPSLGALGEQDLTASITRAKEVADMYRSLSQVPVVPTFEIIATVAQGSPGYDGMYSYVTPVSQLVPWVDAATKAGMYVVLDLQPGRANLLTQAKVYASLLERPNVGLALDSEWKLQPGQKPLQQIGSVNVSEINSVIHWLAGLTDRYHLPQKLVVLHQFRLSMIIGEQDLDTSEDDLSILIHMDGQGTPNEKLQTWDAVVAAAPKHVWFGWKNFIVKDTPMISPQATMANKPTPVMISYQ